MTEFDEPVNIAPAEFLAQLNVIERGVWGTPCSITLHDGRSFEMVMAEDNPHYSDAGGWINPQLVATVKPCLYRMPFRFSQILRNAGETGMGYQISVVHLKDGNSFVVSQGGAATDLIDLPAGYTCEDIVGVEPHAGRGRKPIERSNRTRATVHYALPGTKALMFPRRPNKEGSKPLPLPDKLLELIAAGIWPADRLTAMAQNSRSLVSPERVRAIAPEETRIYLEKPPFSTLAEEAAGKAFSFWKKSGSLEQIDAETAFIIGDFGMGSRAPIVLDCSRGFANPPVLRLRRKEDGQTEWVKCAETFEEFVELLHMQRIAQPELAQIRGRPKETRLHGRSRTIRPMMEFRTEGLRGTLFFFEPNDQGRRKCQANLSVQKFAANFNCDVAPGRLGMLSEDLTQLNLCGEGEVTWRTGENGIQLKFALDKLGRVLGSYEILAWPKYPLRGEFRADQTQLQRWIQELGPVS